MAHDRLILCDVGPRDGLQNAEPTLSPELRAAYVNRLAATGLPRIEAVSFVNPKRVPQMAGAEEVMDAVERKPGVIYAGLALNERGYDRALACGVDLVQYVVPLSETFAEKNQGTTVEAAAQVGIELAARAKNDGVGYAVTLSVAFGCPYDGKIDAARVLTAAEHLAAGGVEEIMLADTIGVGVPTQVRELVTETLGLGLTVGVHFHNTRNTGYANAVAAVESGATIIDASTGGLGGCPFTPNATGNIATEDLVYLLEGMGIETGVNLEALFDVSRWLSEQMGADLPGLTYQAGGFAPIAS
ncbi:MAG: hydroxymethylglutaryl-CoA lyase [Solirubrobacteraceae bacterium]|jgi:isopropylmalate/homocitrate/citramalate synthase|nr:hydroxymethylglutaryl-CoA lyase [Solirubrobacteraceae bacterium]MDP4673081.1 hydroxymethylglutaryl-CoA lyase [Solirubrobacteraceae bacterium]